MKEKEEMDKLKTMVDALKTFDSLFLKNTDNLTQNLKSKLTSTPVIQNRGARVLLRMLSAQRNFDDRWIEILKDPELVKLLDFSSTSIPNNFLESVWKKYTDLQCTVDWTKVRHKVNKHTIPPEKIDSELAALKKDLKNLINLLTTDLETHPDKTNQKFIALLRNILNSPIYKSLKEDSSEPIIKLLHRLASAIWIKAPSIDAYASVGKNIAKDIELKNNPLIPRTVLAEQLSVSHERMEKDHYTAHGLSNIAYALTHPLQVLGSLASEGGFARHIPGIFNLDTYDSHGLGNNPSLQGTTTCILNTSSKAYIHNCYGGSPTIGDHNIAPEFEAVIVAAENNQMNLKEGLDPFIPSLVIYNNLQNLDKIHGEAPRSRTIMLLNQKYPLSFKGSTFAKDSTFYLMREQKHIVWKNSQNFARKMKKQLLKSFDPEQKEHGFYFHGFKQEWVPIFDSVIKSATEHFSKISSDFNSKELQGAYQEYVYSMLNAVIEMEAVQTLIKRGIKDVTIMTVSACKENIDRGGMENTKYMYTKLKENDPNRLSLLLGVMHSRALSVRDRVILKPRLPQVLSFIKTTDPKLFRKNLRSILQLRNYCITESTYNPYWTVPN